VIAVVGILPLDVGQIGGRDMEAMGQKPGNQERHRRLRTQERRRIAELIDRCN